ncbi:Signal transduction histidine kinase [Acetitomaculum ruminis DSM 5522]|uniref:Circadian input-output histidine kinase CikA n=1 Tax=Acetitomaculum ruminis DSM 5522 TaxID=1120918 RepID=A0A1I1AKS7_9FIRM|nr:response regulator [Acetitomaculum ruminis]SFB38629.1 Signal transduction histidine kinase [Acetitomaculum ruminis DSM 5522]
MLQITFTMKDFNDYNKMLLELRTIPKFYRATSIFADIIIGDRNKKKIGIIVELLKTRIPNIKIAGSTTTMQYDQSKQTSGIIIISFLLLEKSDVEVLVYDGNLYKQEEGARKLREDLKRIEDVSCVKLYINSSNIDDNSDFFDAFVIDNPEIVFAGCIASGALFSYEEEIFLVSNEGVMDSGVVAVVFKGKDLYAKTIFDQGWEPSGIEHVVTKMSGKNKLLEVDNLPVTSLFEKYLGIEVNEYLPMQIIEFPLMVRRGNYDIARGIIGMDEDGGLWVTSDIKVNDKVRLSIGIVSDMLKKARQNAATLVDFQPEAMFLTICLSRSYYLREEQQKELNFYLAIAPSLAGCSCSGEIAKIDNKLFWLNCSVVALVLREGEVKEKDKVNYPPLPDENDDEKNNHIPLMDKISHFMKVSTSEFILMQEREKEMLLKQEIEAEKAANEAKSAFLSNMSHEIRTPINSVLGMDEMILRESREENIKEYAEHIRNAGNTLLYLINDILDFSKIEAGKMEIIQADYSLSSVLYDLIIMTHSRLENKQLKLNIEVDKQLPDECLGDEMRIRQVILNILNNAIKYTNKGSVTLSVSFNKVDDKYVDFIFHVKDTGIGIKEEDLSKLFSPFERIEEKRNRTIEGTGLGMTITKNLLNMMGSFLEVESVYGEGSDFHFTLRQEVVNWTPIGDFKEKAKDRNKNLASETLEDFRAPDADILVVDDTSMNLVVIRNLLKRLEVKVDTEESGFAALEAVKKKKYDIIFMDHRMPKMDGSETLKKIKEMPEDSLNAHTPVIVLTANAIAGMKEKLLMDGFDEYLSKPVNSKELEETIRRFLPEEKIIATVKREEKSLPQRLDKWGYIEDDSLRELIKMLDDEINQLSVNKAIENCGDAEAYIKILKDFVMGAKAKNDELNKYLSDNNIEDFTIKIHALKTSTRLIGAYDLSDMCRRLEEAGNNRDIAYIDSHFPFVMEWFLEIIQQIIDIFPKENDEKKEMIDEAGLREAYGAIYEFAGVFDIDSVDKIIANLEEYRLPDGEKERFEKIKQGVLNVDYDTILQLLSRDFD